MAVVEALFRAQPALGWLAVACVLLSAELASAKMRFAWVALAALAPALLAAAQVRIGRTGEVVLFLALAALATVLSARERRAIRARAPRVQPDHGLPTPTADLTSTSMTPHLSRARRRSQEAAAAKPKSKPLTAPAGDPAMARALVGQTARSLTTFSNGLGRVWIGGAEWGAELVTGESLAPDAPVEVVGVSGGVRLRVRGVS